MKCLTVRVDEHQHAELARRARLAGVSVADYIRQAALGDDLAALVRDIHAAVCPVPSHGLGREAADALAALVQAGLPARPARQRIEQIIEADPKAGAASIIERALRKD